MIEDCPETDIEFDALGLTIAQKHRSAECFCSRATLDDLLSDEVMAPVLRSAGYEPDEFREMMAEMAWNLVTPCIHTLCARSGVGAFIALHSPVPRSFSAGSFLPRTTLPSAYHKRCFRTRRRA
jgi:hypothetical protein